MSRYSSLPLLCLGAALTLSGCGEMVFKRGAGPGSMADEQAGCRAKTDSEPAYIACMEQLGYVVKGSQESVFVGGADEPGASASSSGSSFFVEGAAATPAAAPAVTKPAPVSVAPAPTPAPAAQPAPVAAPQPAAVDPLEQVDVASWWKLGGSAGQLEAARADCVTKLGNAHRPDPESTKVTRAMVGCLRDAGWRGIGR